MDKELRKGDYEYRDLELKHYVTEVGYFPDNSIRGIDFEYEGIKFHVVTNKAGFSRVTATKIKGV